MNRADFNLSTEKNSGNRVPKEGVDFVIVRDGNGGEIKLLNLENDDLAPREGIVELVPLKYAKGVNGKLRHENQATFSVIRDKRTGWLIGIPLAGYQGANKEIKFEKIVITGSEFLDLSIPKQRLKWICIKNSPFLKGSPNFLHSSKTVYEAVDRERQSVEFFVDRKNKRKAVDIAENLHGPELIDMAIALGLDPNSMSTIQLEMAVIKYAENPEKVNGKNGAERFLEIYNSDTRLELIILNRGIKTGVVSLTRIDGYTYNGVSMGFSEFEAVQFLKKNPQLLNSIDLRSKNVDDSSTKVADSTPKPVVKDEKDIELERLKRELAEARAMAAKSNSIAAEAVASKDIEEIDPELAELLKEAKQLSIKAYHLIGKNDEDGIRKEKLRKKIQEAKSSLEN